MRWFLLVFALVLFTPLFPGNRSVLAQPGVS